MNHLKDQLSALFRTIEADLGTHGFCILVLESFLNALSQCRVRDKEELLKQMAEIMDLIQNVKPKYAILIDSFYKILTQAQEQSLKEIKKNIRQIKHYYQEEMKLLVQAANAIDANGKNILIFDHSHSVHNVLRYLHEKGQNFTILLAEQDHNKTEDNILFLSQENIPFKVVPAYMISHLEEGIDMAFFGGVTFQKGEQLVMDPGSKSMISELKIEHKPIYVFLTTSKFSLWKVKDFQKEIHVKSDMKLHHGAGKIQFERVKFSHDRVSVDLIDHIVTEKGLFTPTELQHEFHRLMEQREKQGKALVGIKRKE